MKNVLRHFLILELAFLACVMAACTSIPMDGNPPVSAPDPKDNPPVITPAPGAPLPELPPLSSSEKCFEPGTYGAIDMAMPTDQRFLELMRRHKVKTIIRYYDWTQESIKGKTPKSDELARIFANGLSFMAVFQHFNSSYSTFQSSSRPAIDLARILELAKLWKQPKGSAAFIGVDGDFWKADELATVRRYFSGISPGLRAAGYRVGMYGSGANCLSLEAAGLIDRSSSGKPLCWIAGSSGWSRTQEVLKAGKYVLKQRVNQKCAGKSLDYNTTNADDFGQWRPL